MNIKIMKNTLKIFLMLLLSLISGLVYSQTLNDAKQEYLDGLQLINDEPETALELFNKSLEICTKLGDEATELKIEVESKLPTCYYKIAYNKYQAKKTDESLKAFLKASEIAEKYGDNDIKSKSDDYIPKLYYMIGTDLFKANNFDGALQNFVKSSELDITYAKAFYGQALVYSKKGDIEKAIVACDKAIETATQTNDLKTLEKVESMAHNIYLKQGNDEKVKGNYLQGINKLKKAIEYEAKSSQAHGLLASCYNQLNQYDNAIAAANKAIEFEDGGNEKKAGLFYELGMAYKGKGEVQSACSAFKNALFGAFIESAKYQVEVVLKCE